jgi:hypothetical protein
MDTELAINSRAERERLDALRTTLAGLSEDLAEKEMEQTRMRAELASFQHQEFRYVGRLYTELDEIMARIAEKKAAQNPEEDVLAAEARRRRSRAERSSREYRHWNDDKDTQGIPPSPPSESAKKLYRKIAAELHPDLANDEGARAVRTQFMAELNEAYAQGDIERMQDILEAWEKSPEAVPGENLEAEMERLERTIEQIQKKLESVESDMNRLRNSSLYRLMLRAREASRQGRDLMAELAEQITQKIARARKELAEL